jgi:hypothetical protein
MARNKNIPEIMTAIMQSSVLLFAMSGADEVKILEVSTVELKARMVNRIANGFHLSGGLLLICWIFMIKAIYINLRANISVPSQQQPLRSFFLLQ